MYDPAHWRRLALPLLLVVALAGCGAKESISTYETPRTEPRATPVDAAKAAGELDHMLTAIVPQGQTAWFFKLVARGDQVEPLRKRFEEFVASVTFVEGQAKPEWKLPAGWEEKPGDAMRAATIDVPAGDVKLPLAVSSLPLSGAWVEYVENNVNRWMGQLQQPALSAEKVAELSRTAPLAGGGEATLIELVGVMDRQATPGMMPPGHPPVGAAAAGSAPAETDRATTASAAGAPGAGSAASGAPATGAEFPKPREFTYQPPEGWQPGRYGGMRTAAFVVSSDGKSAEVTVMPFPATGAMADPVAQAERWAGQVGLTASEADLEAARSELTIDGAAGDRFELLGPAGPQAKGTLAAMVRQGERIWFFKMTGDRGLIEGQREAFDQFLQSIKFTGEAS